MQTDSSARSTCFKSLSTVECTATVRMPSSLQARRMRSAISPRFAMTTFSNMVSSLDNEQRLPEFHGVAVAGENRLDDAGLVGLDLVHHLHGLDDAQHVAFLDALAHVGEGLGARRG